MITEWTGLANVLPWKIAIKSKNNTLRSYKYKYTSNTSYLDVTSICIGRKQKQRTGRKIGRSLKLDWFHTTIIKQSLACSELMLTIIHTQRLKILQNYK